MFSKTEAMQIVGGKKRLYRLVEQGKIRFEKPTNKQNGKWYCNAADVLRFAMP
ncbi:MAG: helix-turn-helix domain-containing protein [Muribaculaceae bacterium]|nr:helix-turn-helix domain-containing protein [Muribaculaceae bacterium]